MIDLLQIKSCKEFFTLFLKLYKERKYQMTILRWSIWRRRNDKVWKNKMSQVNLWLGEGRSFSRVGSVHRWKISGGELTLETPSLKVSENQNMNDSNSTWILVSIWFVIPLELVCVFVMSMGDWFKQWHCGDNYAWTFKKVKHGIYINVISKEKGNHWLSVGTTG